MHRDKKLPSITHNVMILYKFSLIGDCTAEENLHHDIYND